MLFIIFGIIIFAVVLALLITSITDYLEEMESDLYCNSRETEHKQIKDFPKIKFSIFKKYYFINPESWELKQGRVIKGHNSRIASKDPCFTFNFIDFWRYRFFIKTLAKQEKHKEDDKVYIKLLELVQEDINKLKDQTMENNTRAVNTIIEVSKRLKEEI